MNLQEAYKTLGLANNASEEEAKKKYKELTRKYHPDVNKEPDADVKFKKINEAYDRIKKGDEPVANNPFEGFGFNPFAGNPFGRSSGKKRRISADNISTSVHISFQESVLGTKKNINYSRMVKCQGCDGEGAKQIHNGCDKCKGKGQTSVMHGGMVFIRTCDKCHGNVKVESCGKCNGDGLLDAEVSVTVNIPGGVSNDNVLRLAGMGNFVNEFMNIDQHSDVHLHISVEQDPDLFLDGSTVICNLQISLLEALQGCYKTVRTVLGDKDIKIPALSRNNDFITIPKVGINRQGNQKVILDVQYPKDVNQIIDVLQSEES